MAFISEISAATLIVLAATGIAELLYQTVELTRLSIFFLSAVIVAALLLGMRAAVYSAFLAFAAYNFTLVQPRYTFAFAGADDAMTLGVFLAMALLIGGMAARVNESDRLNRRRADHLSLLLSASRDFASRADEIDMLAALGRHLEIGCRGDAHILTSADEAPPDLDLTEGELRSLAYASGSPHVLGASGSWRARRLSADDSRLVIWRVRETRWREAQTQGRLCELIIDIAEAALARSRLAALKLENEADKRAAPVRQAILASLSHDLRTPLTSILASASSLADYGDRFDGGTRAALANGIVCETTRLSGYLEGLFSLSQIEADAIEPSMRGVYIGESLEGAARRLGQFGRTAVTFEDDSPHVEAQADPALLEQLFYNLLDNAARHGGPKVKVQVEARRRPGGVILVSVSDTGPGVADGQEERIFQKFYRAGARPESPGTGVGLAVAKGFVEIMGGRIWAERPTAEGCGLTVCFELCEAINK